MAEDKILALWKKAVLRDPLLPKKIREEIEDDSDLTPEEKEAAIERLMGWSAGKFASSVYATRITSLEQAAEIENQRARAKQYETVRAYGKDVEGSFQEAKNAADRSPETTGNLYNNSLRRDAFISKAYSVAANVAQEERKKEVDAIALKYSTDRNQVNVGGADDIRVKSTGIRGLDVSIAMSEDIGRNIGTFAGEVRNEYAAGVSGVLGEDSYLGKKLDLTNRVVAGTTEDIKQIFSESPWIPKSIKNAFNRDETTPTKLEDSNSFFAKLGKLMGTSQFLGDIGDVLSEWYRDPRTLCCFIKNLAALGNITLQEAFAGLEIHWSLTKFFNKFIAILKIIKRFLQMDLSYDFMLGIDLSLSMMKVSAAAMVAFLVALQQMIEDEVYFRLMSWVEQITHEEFRQCFPFERLLRIIADYVTGPEGLFKFIQDYIDSFLNGFSKGMHYGFGKGQKQKMIDVTAIDRLISLIEQIRDGLLNLELCLEADFTATEQRSDDAEEKRVSVGNDVDDLTDRVGEKLSRTGDAERSAGVPLARVVYPTGNEVHAFITSRLGETKEFADHVLATANKASNISGPATGSPDGAGTDLKSAVSDLQKSIGDCSRTLDSDRIRELSKILSSWDLTI